MTGDKLTGWASKVGSLLSHSGRPHSARRWTSPSCGTVVGHNTARTSRFFLFPGDTERRRRQEQQRECVVCFGGAPAASETWTRTTECRATDLWVPWRWRARYRARFRVETTSLPRLSPRLICVASYRSSGVARLRRVQAKAELARTGFWVCSVLVELVTPKTLIVAQLLISSVKFDR